MLICVLIAPISFIPRPSFAYLSAPLLPTYITECDARVACAVGQSFKITTSPVVVTQGNGSTFIDYIYESPASGGVPAYITECGPRVACTLGQSYKISSSPIVVPQSPGSTLIGYVNETQVSGTVPMYISQCSAEVACGAGQSFKITNSPIILHGELFTTFIGYVYPSIPAPTVYTLSPTYFIGSVIYVPPGQGPSSITYGAGTVTGTTVSTTQSWSNPSSAGLSIGIASITFGDGYSGSTSTSTDMQMNATQSTTYKGPASNSINHDYDQIVIFVGVKVTASVDYLGNVTWAADFSKIASEGFAETGYPISVGCLRANSTIAPSLCTATVNFLNSVGIASADYASILGADPFQNPAASQTPASSRFVLIDAVNFLPDPTTSTVTYTVNNSSTTTNSTTTSYSYSVGAGVSVSILKASDTFTWTNSSTQSNRTGSTNSSAFTISLPSSPYSGPSTLYIYMDTIYKTFMFSFLQ
jgi:hypothetical protein